MGASVLLILLPLLFRLQAAAYTVTSDGTELLAALMEARDNSQILINNSHIDLVPASFPGSAVVQPACNLSVVGVPQGAPSYLQPVVDFGYGQLWGRVRQCTVHPPPAIRPAIVAPQSL